jgi:hypothetical protein
VRTTARAESMLWGLVSFIAMPLSVPLHHSEAEHKSSGLLPVQ